MTHLPDMTAFDREPGLAVQYRRGIVNHCPVCGGAQWLVGRTMAQCAHCDAALPLAAHGQWLHRTMFASRPAPNAGHA